MDYNFKEEEYVFTYKSKDGDLLIGIYVAINMSWYIEINGQICKLESTLSAQELLHLLQLMC